MRGAREIPGGRGLEPPLLCDPERTQAEHTIKVRPRPEKRGKGAPAGFGAAPPHRPGERRHHSLLAHAGERSLGEGEEAGPRLLLAPSRGPEQLKPLAEQYVDVVRREHGGCVIHHPFGVADLLRPGAQSASEGVQPPQQQRAGRVNRHHDATQRGGWARFRERLEGVERTDRGGGSQWFEGAPRQGAAEGHERDGIRNPPGRPSHLTSRSQDRLVRDGQENDGLWSRPEASNETVEAGPSRAQLGRMPGRFEGPRQGASKVSPADDEERLWRRRGYEAEAEELAAGACSAPRERMSSSSLASSVSTILSCSTTRSIW